LDDRLPVVHAGSLRLSGDLRGRVPDEVGPPGGSRSGTPSPFEVRSLQVGVALLPAVVVQGKAHFLQAARGRVPPGFFSPAFSSG